MKKNRHWSGRLLSGLLSLAMAVSLSMPVVGTMSIPVAADTTEEAEEEISAHIDQDAIVAEAKKSGVWLNGVNGTCTWTLYKDGTMTLSPGALADYTIFSKYRNYIENLICLHSEGVGVTFPKPADSSSGTNLGLDFIGDYKICDYSYASLINLTGNYYIAKAVQIDFSHATLGATQFSTTDYRYSTSIDTALISACFAGAIASNLHDFDFRGAKNLKTVDLSDFSTPQLTSLDNLFNGCSSLDPGQANYSGWTTGTISNIQYMFSGSGITSLVWKDIPIDLSNVTLVDYLCSGCKNLQYINLNGLDTSKLEDQESSYADYVYGMIGMFQDCDILQVVDLSGMDFGKVSTLANMFENCDNLLYANFSGANLENTRYYDYLFHNCKSLIAADFTNAKMPSQIYIGDMFRGCTSLESVNFDGCTCGYNGIYNRRYDSADCWTFDGCQNLMTIVFPSGQGQVPSGDSSRQPFSGCYKLQYIVASAGSNISGYSNSAYSVKKVASINDLTDAERKTVVNRKLTIYPNGGEMTGICCNQENPDTSKITITTTDASYLKAPVITNGDYPIIGWNTAADGTGTAYDVNEKVGTIADTPIYAQWSAAVHYDANGGTGTMEDQSVIIGKRSVLSANAFTKDKNKFIGWNTAADGTGTTYEDGEEITPKGNVTLYATWRRTHDEEYDDLVNSGDHNGQTSVVDSGYWGTCHWVYTSDKTLTVYEGRGGLPSRDKLNDNVTPQAWSEYADQILSVKTHGTIVCPTDCEYLFAGLTNCQKMDLSGFDTSFTTNMHGMFKNCEMLRSLDLSNFVTKKVTDMAEMFSNCGYITNINLSGFDTSSVKTMDQIFADCENIEALDVTSFDTGKVETFNHMFSGCKKLKSLDLAKFNTANVKNMNSMFYDCRVLPSLDLSHFDVQKVTDFSGMFYNNRAADKMSLANFKTTAAVNMNSMFKGCSNVRYFDIHNFNTANVTDTASMFEGCKAVEFLNLASFAMTNDADMSSMFKGCSSLIYLDMQNAMPEKASEIKINGVKNTCINMQNFLYGCSSLETVDISKMFDQSDTIGFYISDAFTGCGRLTTIFANDCKTPVHFTDDQSDKHVFNGDTHLGGKIPENESGPEVTYTTDTDDKATTSAYFTAPDQRGWVTFVVDDGYLPLQKMAAKLYGEWGTFVHPIRKGYDGNADWYADNTYSEIFKTSHPMVLPEDATEAAAKAYYQWNLKSYSIRYNLKDGSGAKTVSYTMKDGEYTLPTPERTGYIFTGWSGTGIEGKADTVTITPDNVQDNMEFTANWQAVGITVTLDANGGVVTPDKLTGYTKGDSLGSLPKPDAREGYTFDYWYQKAEDGTQTKVTASTAVDADMTICAHWTPNTYKIVYNLDGGEMPEGKTNPETYTPEDTITLVDPVKENCDFIGWTGTDLGVATKNVTLYNGSAGNRIYTAHWKAYDPETNKVTFDPAGGVITETERRVKTGEAVGKLPEPAKTGFSFLGWYKADDTRAAAEDAVTKDITLTAKWEPITYSVTCEDWFVDAAGRRRVKLGESDTIDGSRTDHQAGDLVHGSEWGSDATVGAYYAGYQYTGDTSVSVKDSSATVYRCFQGTTTSSILGPDKKAAEGTFSFSTDGKNWTNDTSVLNSVMPYGTTYYIKDIKPKDETLQADYISYNENGRTGSIVYDTDHSCYVYTPYEGNTSVVIHLRYKDCTLTYDANGGSVSGSTQASYGNTWGTLAVPVREGYAFDGWFTAKDGGTEITSETKAESNVTAYAHWTEKLYTVHYDGNGADGGEMADQTFAVNAKTPATLAPNAFTKEGYYFLGWSTSKKARTEKYEDEDEVTGLAGTGQTVNLYAVWKDATKVEEPKNFTLTFDTNGGSSLAQSTTTAVQGDAWGSLPTPIRDGYAFLGWYTAREDGTEITPDTIAQKSITAYAHWKQPTTDDTFTLTLNPAGGSLPDGTNDTITAKYGEAWGTLPEPARDGYAFDGWFTDKTSGAAVTQDTLCGGNRTVYAHWTRIGSAYKIVFNGNGATTGTMADQEGLYHNKKFTLMANQYQNNSGEGIAFTGWALSPDAGAARYANGATLTDVPDDDGDGQVTLYAVWKTGVYTVTVPTTIQINDVTAGPVNASSAPYDITVNSLAPDDKLGEQVSVKLLQTNLKSANPSNKLTLKADSTDNPLEYVQTDTKQDKLNVNGTVVTADTWSGAITYRITESALNN